MQEEGIRLAVCSRVMENLEGKKRKSPQRRRCSIQQLLAAIRKGAESWIDAGAVKLGCLICK